MHYAAWFIAGFVLLVAELMTGTFYLLVLAVAFACAGIANLLGASITTEIMVASIVAFGGAMGLRKFRMRGKADDRNDTQSMDVGQRISVSSWSEHGRARAQYRGASWDVVLAPGQEAQAGEYEIVEVRGSQLVVKRV